MTAPEKDDVLGGAADGSPEGADATSEKVDEAIEAEVIEEQGEVQEDTPNLFEAITAEVTSCVIAMRGSRPSGTTIASARRRNAPRSACVPRRASSWTCFPCSMTSSVPSSTPGRRRGRHPDGRRRGHPEQVLADSGKAQGHANCRVGRAVRCDAHQAVGTDEDPSVSRGNGRQGIPARLQDGRSRHTSCNGRDKHRRPRKGAGRSY